MIRGAEACRRLKVNSWRASEAVRSAACRMISTSGRSGSSDFKPFRTTWAYPEMTVSMLLKSWATPPASRPIVSIFWECASWAWLSRSAASARLRSVTSRKTSAVPRYSPSVRIGEAVISRSRPRNPISESQCSSSPARNPSSIGTSPPRPGNVAKTGMPTASTLSTPRSAWAASLRRTTRSPASTKATPSLTPWIRASRRDFSVRITLRDPASLSAISLKDEANCPTSSRDSTGARAPNSPPARLAVILDSAAMGLPIRRAVI